MIQKFEFEKLPFDISHSTRQPQLITSFRATDERGALVKDYNIDVFAANNIDFDMKEVFFTESKRGVIRANHFQLPHGSHGQQAKIVRCVRGSIYDVVTDLRPDSSTYGRSMGFLLTEDNYKQLYVPEWFGHGYIVLEDSVVCYRANEVFTPGDSGIKWDDPDLAIDWRIPDGMELIVSEKDRNLMSFKEYDELVRTSYRPG